MSIRDATYDDYPAVLELCREFWKYAPFGDNFDSDHTARSLDMCMDAGMFLVSSDLTGFIAGAKFPSLCDPSVIIGTELGWYAKPTYNVNITAVKLLLCFESQAAKQGVTHLHMGHMMSYRPDIAEKIYLKLGYVLHEKYYMKSIKNGNWSASSCRSCSRVEGLL